MSAEAGGRFASVESRVMRRPPRCVLEFEFERERGVVMLLAETYEDERRLRAFLRRSTSFQALPALVAQLLDDLDQIDEG